MLSSISRIVKADKLITLYRGLILSRTMYAVDAWYPFISAADRKRLDSLHYRACSVITTGKSDLHRASTYYEAGFRSFDSIARDDITAIADKMRRYPETDPLLHKKLSFGPQWVARLFRDESMPTATLRSVMRYDGTAATARFHTSWPDPVSFDRRTTPDSPTRCSLRDVGVLLDHGDPRLSKLKHDYRSFDPTLRPLPRIHPWAPYELAIFDDRVSFITESPDGLVKPDNFDKLPDDSPVKRPFAEANAKRMKELIDHNHGGIYIFTDGARQERMGRLQNEQCAGAFVISRHPDPEKNPNSIILKGQVPVSPIACVYSAELAAIETALKSVRNNFDTLFGSENRKLVLVTDSKSSLESVKTTWMRKIGFLEQNVSRLLYELATEASVTTTLAFVFSHAGGAPGNAYADKLAENARRKRGHEWTDSLWHIDTTRRILRNAHKQIDKQAGTKLDGITAFRFRNSTQAEPSAPLPPELSRSQEILLYRARLGLFTRAGGTRHDQRDQCPLCNEPHVLGRDGDTLTHILECAAAQTSPPLRLSIRDLWENPVDAAAVLQYIDRLVASRQATVNPSLRRAAKSSRHHHQGDDRLTAADI